MKNIFLFSCAILIAYCPQRSLANDVNEQHTHGPHTDQHTEQHTEQQVDEHGLDSGSHSNDEPHDESHGGHAPHVPHGQIEGIAVVGSLVWDIIKFNKPAFQKQLPVVHAVPKGTSGWEHLDGWKGPVRKVFTVVKKNGFKQETVRIRLLLQYYYNGGHEGSGHYLANVTLVPLETRTLWGYKASAVVITGTPINIGSHEDPVAELPLHIQIDYSTAVMTKGQAINLRLRGTGEVLVDD